MLFKQNPPRRLRARPTLLGALTLITAGALQAQAPAPAEPPQTPFARAATQVGIRACAPRIHQVSQFITGNNAAAGFLFTPPAQPDQRLVAISFEVQPAGAPVVYASASFAPGQANGCGAQYEAVAWWPSACEAVAGQQFAQMKKGRPLHKEILMLEGPASSRVFLMPAGSGCVSIKKEVVQ